ncbi:MAG TPA: TetR/AcrR family transcriptional regulator, partial [Nevskiaceae bacterium]|nr:TetR/AcrR family transcriptional regulator [Nevskiaceae bacterium]
EPVAVQAVLLLFRGLGRLLADPRMAIGIAGYWLIPDKPETAGIREAQRTFEQNGKALIAEVLRRGQAQGRLDLAGDLDDVARAMISLVEAVVLPLRHQTPDEVHRTLGVLARSFFRAYASAADLLQKTREI